MVKVRQEELKDQSAIRSLHLAAFQTPAEANLVDLLRTTNYYDKELSLVAEKDGEIVGHILFTRLVIKDNNHSWPALSLAPLAVLPDSQKQGIGQLLVTKGLERCKYLGYKLVAVLGDPKYYRSFGFEKAADYQLQPPAAFPEEYFMIRNLSDEELSISGMVLYPKEFKIVM